MTFLLPTRLLRHCAWLLSAGLLLGATQLSAQEIQLFHIENSFSSVFVTNDQNSGRFWFATGQQGNYTRYLYPGSKLASSITSNVVFRVEHGSEVSYFCNTPLNFSLGARPTIGSDPVPYLPYDQMRTSPSNDTLEMVWSNIDGYKVTMRFVAEAPRFQYDDGADILLEFDYYQIGSPSSDTKLGIFLLLDQDNGTASGDQSSIMTDRGYLNTKNSGQIFRKATGNLAGYYLCGDFTSDAPSNILYSLHRLQGTSLGGAELTAPDVFSVGNWRTFSKSAWNPSTVSNSIADAATTVQWENLGTEGRIRTAFGTTSAEGNNFHYFRDADVFSLVRTERVIRRESPDAPIDPSEFDVEMWVSNTSEDLASNPQIQLDTNLTFTPMNGSHISVDPSTPIMQQVQLAPGQTKKITWHLHVDKIDGDTLVAMQFLYRDANGVDNFRPMSVGLPVHITFETESSTNGVNDDVRSADREQPLAIRSVTPQPFNTQSASSLLLNIEAAGIGVEGAYVELVSTNGIVVARKELNRSAGSSNGSFSIPLALPTEISPGLYLVRLVSATGTSQTKVIVTQ